MAEWEYLTYEELAELLQMNPQTLRNMVNRGELEAVQVGRGKRIPRDVAVHLAGGTGWEVPQLLTVAQVARLLKVCEMTVRNWVAAGLLPAVWIGKRRVRIKREDLEDFIERGSTVATGPPAGP